MSTADGSALQPEREPGIAAAERGLVMLDGPDGVGVTMTPEAAEGTARALLAAAAEARAQQQAQDEGSR